MTFTRWSTRLTQNSTAAMCSRMDMVADSPVVPQTHTASTPDSIWAEGLELYETIEDGILREHDLKEPIIWESN